MAKRGSSRDEYLIVLSPEQRELLRRLGTQSAPAADQRDPSESIILSPDEVALLKELGGRTAPREPRRASAGGEASARKPRRVKRTADLVVSEGELNLLRELAEPPPAKRPNRRTTEIVLSRDELEFLRALSNQEFSSPAVAAPGSGEASVVVPLTPEEAQHLNDVTREGYSFITPGERRARLILREKLQAAMRRPPAGEPPDEKRNPAD